MKGFKKVFITILALAIILCALPFYLLGYLLRVLKIFYMAGFRDSLEHFDKLDKFITKELNDD